MNPYLAGLLLGLVLLAAMYLSGRGLGASGGIKYLVVSVVGALDMDHALQSPYYARYFTGDKGPFNNWLVFTHFRNHCLSRDSDAWQYYIPV